MDYDEGSLPVHLKHGDVLTLGDGTTVSFDTNAEAKDVYLGGDFSPAAQLYPGMEHEIAASGGTFRLTATYGDDLLVEKTG